MKAVLRGKLITLSASKKKQQRAYISSLTAHLKALEHMEEHSPKKCRQQEIIKLRAEINKFEKKKNCTESTKPGDGSLKKINKINISLARLTRAQ